MLTAHLLRYIKENETSFLILKDFFVILRLHPNTDFNNLTLKNVGKNGISGKNWTLILGFGDRCTTIVLRLFRKLKKLEKQDLNLRLNIWSLGVLPLSHPPYNHSVIFQFLKKPSLGIEPNLIYITWDLQLSFITNASLLPSKVHWSFATRTTVRTYLKVGGWCRIWTYGAYSYARRFSRPLQ